MLFGKCGPNRIALFLYLYYFSCHKDNQKILDRQIFRALFSRKKIRKKVGKIFAGLTIISYL